MRQTGESNQTRCTIGGCARASRVCVFVCMFVVRARAREFGYLCVREGDGEEREDRVDWTALHAPPPVSFLPFAPSSLLPVPFKDMHPRL